MSRLTDTDSEEVTRFIECPGCEGMGSLDVGDCEDGVTRDCELCGGACEIEEDLLSGDEFKPETDAWKASE